MIILGKESKSEYSLTECPIIIPPGSDKDNIEFFAFLINYVRVGMQCMFAFGDEGRKCDFTIFYLVMYSVSQFAVQNILQRMILMG